MSIPCDCRINNDTKKLCRLNSGYLSLYIIGQNFTFKEPNLINYKESY